jgi:hypothetical protein
MCQKVYTIPRYPAQHLVLLIKKTKPWSLGFQNNIREEVHMSGISEHGKNNNEARKGGLFGGKG